MSLIDLLNGGGAWLAARLAVLSMELAVLAAVVALALTVLRVQSAALRHAFWGLVLAKPVVSLMVASPLSLYAFLQPVSEYAAPVLREHIPHAGYAFPAEFPVYPVMERSFAVGRAPVMVLPEPPAPVLAWQGWIFALWSGMALAMAARLVLGAAYLAWLRHASREPVPDQLVALIDEVRARMGVRRRIRIRLSASPHGPVLAGILRPVVLLPSEAFQSLTCKQMELVLAHESAHVRRWDNLVLLVQRLAEILLFFHPVVWVCGRVMRREAEKACDDSVLKVYGDGPAYADSLARVAELRFGLTRRLLVSTFAAAESNCASRIRRILGGRARRATLGLTVAALALLVLIALAGLPAASGREEPETTPQEDTMPDHTAKTLPGDIAPLAGDRSSVPFALATALQHLGDAVTYERLMGASGLAFRTQLAYPDWCPSAGHISVGFDCTPYLNEVCGRAIDWTWPKASPPSEAELETIRARVTASIDEGRPVLHSLEECSLIIGYQEDGRMLLKHPAPYYGPDTWMPLDQWDWAGAGVLGEPVEVSAELLRVRPLKLAVEMALTDRMGGCVTGFAAYEVWINRLRDAVANASLSEDQLRGLMLSNGWCYLLQRDARECAAAYLTEIRTGFEGDALERLDKATALYTDIARILRDAESSAPLAWLADTPGGWTQDMRNIQANALERAFSLEREAITEIQAILALLGEEIPGPRSEETALPNADAPIYAAVSEESEHGSRFIIQGAPVPPETDLPFTPEDIGIPATLRMALEFLGEGLDPDTLEAHGITWRSNQTLMYFMGVTGEGFRFRDTLYLHSDARELERIFDEALGAAGYTHQLVLPVASADSLGYTGPSYDGPGGFRSLVVAHLRGKRLPLLLVECGGGWPDWRLIVGYEENGAKLLGFGGKYESGNHMPGTPANPLRSYDTDSLLRDGAFPGPQVVLLTGRQQRPRPDEAYRKALAFGLEIMRRDEIAGKPAGPRFFDEWSAKLADDSLYAAADEVELKRLFEDHRVFSSDLAERRAYCSSFLRQAQAYLQDAVEPLDKAMTCFNAEHDYVWEIWGLTGGYGNVESHLIFKDAEIRTQIREVIEKMKQHDLEAAGHIQNALAAVGVGEPIVMPESAGQAVATGPEIVVKDRIRVAGITFEGQPDSAQIKALWERLMPRMTEIGNVTGPPYEIWRSVPGQSQGDVHELLVGREVSSFDNLPPDMAGWEFPAQTYARLTVQGYGSIGPACQHYWDEWLPGSDTHEQNGLYMLQEYDEDTTGGDETVRLYFPIKEKGAMTTTTHDRPDTMLLESFGRVGFFIGDGGNPEDNPLPGVVRAVSEYLGNDLGLPGFDETPRNGWQWETCALIHGVSGQGVQFGWDNHAPQADIWGADLMEMYRLSLEAAGLSHRMLLKSLFASGLNAPGMVSDDPEEYRRWVVESIRNGMPVITLGLFGVPEPGVITGCSADGSVVTGWDYFQGEAQGDDRLSMDEAGRFVLRDWTRDLQGLILITGRQPRPDTETLYKDALARCLSHMTQEGTPEKPLGFAGYAAWVRVLLDDAAAGVLDGDALRRTNEVQHGMVGEIAERRAYAGTFLWQASRALPAAAADLHRAAECFDVMHDLCWRAWQTAGSGHIRDNANNEGYKDPALRRELTSIALLHRDLDARAARHIRRALVKAGVPESGLPDVPALPARDSYPGVRVLPYFNGDLDSPIHASTFVSKEPDKNGAFVHDIPAYRGFGERVCSFAGAVQTALAASPRPLSYADIMGHTGLAFRTRWFRNVERKPTAWGDQPWHPVSPHGEQPDVLAALEQATGWRFRMVGPAAGDSLAMERLTTDTVLSLVGGRPIVAGYSTDLGAIHGYHIWSMNFLFRHQHAPDDNQFRVSHRDPRVHGPFIFIESLGDLPDQHQAYVKALGLAVANGLQRGGEDGFLFGVEALRAWRDDLASWETLGPEDRELLFFVNGWCLLHLADAREAAAEYLGAGVALLEPASRESAETALVAYRETEDLLRANVESQRPWLMHLGGTGDAASWGVQPRLDQIDLFDRLIPIETKALEALDKVDK